MVPSIVIVDMLKNFSCSSGPPLSFSMTCQALRALDLEAVVLALDRVTVRARGRAAVDLDVEVRVAAGLAVVQQPVRRGRAADVDVLVLGLAEQDAVADHVAGGGGRHVLLGLVDREDRRPS